jgi:hypothetical protein
MVFTLAACKTAASCTDQSGWCSSWASAGYCLDKFSFEAVSIPHFWCRNSCRTCDQSARLGPTRGGALGPTSLNCLPERPLLQLLLQAAATSWPSAQTWPGASFVTAKSATLPKTP